MNKENVTFTGKEYIDYLKYRDDQRQKSKKEINRHLEKYKFHYIMTGVIFLFIMISYAIYDSLTYEPKIWTQPELINLAIGFMVFCIGISWVIHGVGFYLVRR